MSKVRVDTISTLDDQHHIDVTALIALNESSITRTAPTGAVMIPRGTTAQRPTPTENGMIRYNTETDKFEGVQAGVWVNLW